MHRPGRWAGFRAVIALAAALGLAACGSSGPEKAGAAAMGRAASTPTPTGVDARLGPTNIPSGPAPADFIERAEQVARDIRASGDLTDYRSGVHLLSPVVTVPPNLTDEALETALHLGLLTPGPAVTEEPSTTTVAFADGTSRTLDVLGARSALALGRRGPSCADANSVEAVRLDPCPVFITRARLTTRAVMTNHGAARLPAWEFWTDGLTQPYVILAVDPQDLEPPPAVRAGPAPSLPDDMLAGSGLLTATETSVTALLSHGACDRAMLGHVWEGPDLVVVGGTQQGSNSEPCPAVLVVSPSLIRLQAPLGTRPIVGLGSASVVVARR